MRTRVVKLFPLQVRESIWYLFFITLHGILEFQPSRSELHDSIFPRSCVAFHCIHIPALSTHLSLYTWLESHVLPTMLSATMNSGVLMFFCTNIFGDRVNPSLFTAYSKPTHDSDFKGFANYPELMVKSQKFSEIIL